MTYREVIAVMSGRSKWLQYESNVSMRAAWHAAAFQRMKKMPKLESVLQSGKRGRRARQTPEQQAMIGEHWLREMQQRGAVRVIRAT